MITFTKSSGSKSTISFMKRGRDGTSNVVNEGNFRSCFPAQQKHKLVLPSVSLSPRVIIHTIMRVYWSLPPLNCTLLLSKIRLQKFKVSYFERFTIYKLCTLIVLYCTTRALFLVAALMCAHNAACRQKSP